MKLCLSVLLSALLLSCSAPTTTPVNGRVQYRNIAISGMGLVGHFTSNFKRGSDTFDLLMSSDRDTAQPMSGDTLRFKDELTLGNWQGSMTHMKVFNNSAKVLLSDNGKSIQYISVQYDTEVTMERDGYTDSRGFEAYNLPLIGDSVLLSGNAIRASLNKCWYYYSPGQSLLNDSVSDLDSLADLPPTATLHIVLTR